MLCYTSTVKLSDFSGYTVLTCQFFHIQKSHCSNRAFNRTTTTTTTTTALRYVHTQIYLETPLLPTQIEEAKQYMIIQEMFDQAQSEVLHCFKYRNKNFLVFSLAIKRSTTILIKTELFKIILIAELNITNLKFCCQHELSTAFFNP